jgi:endogenous inhibitor of DNA gyrase (YacG/DUF329 family)
MPDMPDAPSCPMCRKPADPKFRPFCSKRCADLDLHHWLAGTYAVPVVDDEDEDGLKPAETRDRDG